jgi:uncharacterized protein (DUF302 family)
MNYFFETSTSYTFDQAIDRVSQELKEEGFGILTRIDVKETLKKKLDVDFPRYEILGACNPAYAYKALLVEEKIGIMLPCNIIVQEKPDGSVSISAVDPLASMQAIINPELEKIARQIQAKLRAVIDRLD